MPPPDDLYARAGDWRPPGTGWLAALLGAVDRLFDAVYSSAYNPLYRTGTLAALCLTVALVTGVYLLFVYDTALPWASMAAIQGDLLLGRWIRALHRYASDVAAVAVALHVLRLLVQGKTWGPRALAWITGVLLAGMMFVSALTGFVLVWDQLGQKLAVAGAKMLRLLPLFPEPPDRSFVGDRPVPAPFFFMNLFLHVAVPLGMVGFLWLHTTRLARAAWFPERRVVVGTLAGLVLLSLAWPAPLPPAADLLAIPGRVDADWFYAFWLPLAHGSPAAGLAAGAILTALLLAVPWLLRPSRRALPPPSFADPDTCEGCQQCFKDCPYDAIVMVPGKHPDRHPLLAQVQPSLCVSCGLCAGSCASLAIGPPARTARHQLASARQLVESAADPAHRTLLVACRSNDGVADRLRRRFAADGDMAWFDVDCVGTLHPGTVSYLAGHFGGTVVLGCPRQDCLHREGPALADARILMDQAPAVPGRLARLPIRVLHASIGEWPRIVSTIEGLRQRSPSPPPAGKTRRAVAGAVFSAALLASLALGSRAPQGTDADLALLRLGWRLTGQVKERCRDLTPEELAARPAHMRTPRECVREVLPYDLKAVVDGRVVLARRVSSPGLRADRPLSVEEELVVEPGDRAIAVTFTPADLASGGAVLALERTIRFERGRVALVTLENDHLTLR
jgi:ferredoxin